VQGVYPRKRSGTEDGGQQDSKGKAELARPERRGTASGIKRSTRTEKKKKERIDDWSTKHRKTLAPPPKKEKPADGVQIGKRQKRGAANAQSD